jgi:hypothetical protein
MAVGAIVALISLDPSKKMTLKLLCRFPASYRNGRGVSANLLSHCPVQLMTTAVRYNSANQIRTDDTKITD